VRLAIVAQRLAGLPFEGVTQIRKAKIFMQKEQHSTYFAIDNTDVADLHALCARTTRLEAYPLAVDVVENITIYDGKQIQGIIGDEGQEATLKAEWAYCLKEGPGVFIVKGAYPDLSVIERCSAAFQEIVAEERASSQGKGDHFGQNERIWNSLQKVCLHDPELFIAYYGNPILGLASEAWLGPYYRITAQMNNVKPGNAAQSAHRDYHLGFQSPETISQYPAHAQVMSQYLTLQGAIAHCDMPVEKGPTMLLPYSQHYAPGYLAFRQAEFTAYFVEHKVQIPFAKGDMVFFNPALFHAGGSNSTATDRVANLVQISSAFGRTMETISNLMMIKAVYPILQRRKAENTASVRLIRDTIAAVADGYSFPTNLDSDPPIGGNAPETEQQMMWRALQEDWPLAALLESLNTYETRRQA
jgi:ectoine hydroxylase-related dioxygenase (phytanoyl-CoA dioxygenase family)